MSRTVWTSGRERRVIVQDGDRLFYEHPISREILPHPAGTGGDIEAALKNLHYIRVGRPLTDEEYDTASAFERRLWDEDHKRKGCACGACPVCLAAGNVADAWYVLHEALRVHDEAARIIAALESRKAQVA